MKKKLILSTIIGMALIFSLTSCNQANTNTKNDTSNATGKKISKADDLKTEKIAVQRGTVGQFTAEDLVGKDHTDQVVGFEKVVDAMSALEQGKVKAVIIDERPAKKFIQKKPALTMLKEPVTNESYAIAIKKGNTELVKQINTALDKLTKDGTLQSIQDKYNNDEPVDAKSIDFNVGAKNGKLIMGTEAGFAPYELKTEDGYIGIDVEMMAKVAKLLDKELVIDNMSFDSLPTALNAGKIDVAVAGMTITDDRKENMDFSKPYVTDAKQVVVLKKSDLAK